MNMQFVKAQEVETGQPDISFLEFLGEGVVVEKEYIDPLLIHEDEKVMSDVQQEVKRHDD